MNRKSKQKEARNDEKEEKLESERVLGKENLESVKAEGENVKPEKHEENQVVAKEVRKQKLKNREEDFREKFFKLIEICLVTE